MEVVVEKTALRDLWLVHRQAIADDRGFFMEVFRKDVFAAAGLPTEFVQIDLSHSVRNVLRGLHFQWDPPRGKLMRVTQGTAYLVAVDIRKGSPTLGQWHGVKVSAEDRIDIWAPAGFARAFCVLSDTADIQYLSTGVYNPNGESGILWQDQAIGVKWPVQQPILSEKDARAQSMAEWLQSVESNQFRF